MKNKKFWLFSFLIFLVCLCITYSRVPQTKVELSPTEKLQKVEKVELKSMVLSGKILGADFSEDCAIIVLLVKNAEHVLSVTTRAEITSILPRKEHTPESLVKWIKENPECGGTFGIEKGLVTGVIVTTLD